MNSKITLYISEEERVRLLDVLQSKKGYQYYTVEVQGQFVKQENVAVEWSDQTNSLLKNEGGE